MEQHLAEREFLATEHATVGGLAGYTEGGIFLAPYPAIRRWVARIAALPYLFVATLDDQGWLVGALGLDFSNHRSNRANGASCTR